ncbi:MAG: MFS transporter [Verrucomicrobia bacterium]|nr:MFS transporter [Verrucomicrobiota bacterium]
MTKVDAKTLTDKEKSMLFWASFLALTAAGVGFVFRVMIPSMWADQFQITMEEVGGLTGAALWPIAITMIIFSLLVDKIGYKASMMCAFVLQALSVILTVMAKDTTALWYACFASGLGHGVVEACINPLCASIYRENKSKYLNILHASWPAGIVLGGAAYLLFISGDANWDAAKVIFWIMLIPVFAYGLMFILCKHFPIDERVEANVSMHDMLKEFGGLGAGLASTFLLYEIFGQLNINLGPNKLYICIGLGAAVGAIFGTILRSKGKWMFFVLCLVMIPLATAELGTDAWIKTLMTPIMGSQYAGWAIVLSAGIMMGLRFFAGIPLKFMSPPALLLLSSVFSIVGLFALSEASGIFIFGAFVLYAVGQTFYWPTVLGLVSEQFPKGGAMTLNTVSAMGLLTVGIFGFPFLGAVQDSYNTKTIKAAESALYQNVVDNNVKFKDVSNPENPKEVPIYQERSFFGYSYDSVNTLEFKKLSAMSPERITVLDEKLTTTSQSALKVASILPVIMAIAFGLMLFYFKLKGGYKPVVLAETEKP